MAELGFQERSSWRKREKKAKGTPTYTTTPHLVFFFWEGKDYQHATRAFNFIKIDTLQHIQIAVQDDEDRDADIQEPVELDSARNSFSLALKGTPES